jgi:hypothetical protein
MSTSLGNWGLISDQNNTILNVRLLDSSGAFLGRDTITIASSATLVSNLTWGAGYSATYAAAQVVSVFGGAVWAAQSVTNLNQFTGDLVRPGYLLGFGIIPTSIIGTISTLTDGSSSTNAGNTSQQIFAANPNRKYLFIQNNSNSVLWINFTTAATTSQPSIQLVATASLIFEGNFVPSEAVNIIGASSNLGFTAKQG